MSPKRYKLLEHAIEGFLVTLVASLLVALLLGVYALASLVF